MPDIPAAVLAAAALAIHRAACPLCDDPDHDCARDAAGEEMFIPRARAALEAAAPLLAEAWGVKPPPTALELERSAARVRGRSVACPYCGAAAGKLCQAVDSRGPGSAGYTLSGIHAARKRAALLADPAIPEVPGEH